MPSNHHRRHWCHASPAGLKAVMAAEAGKWVKVARESGAKVE